MVTYVGSTVLKRRLLSKLQQFWAEEELSIFFYKKKEFLMFFSETLESSKLIEGDISDEPVTHCTEFL